MKQPESLELVAEFHKTFKHPISSVLPSRLKTGANSASR